MWVAQEEGCKHLITRAGPRLAAVTTSQHGIGLILYQQGDFVSHGCTVSTMNLLWL